MSDIAFPYPVLGRGQDYVGAEFQSALKVPEGEVAAGQTLALPFELDLNDASIEAEIKSGRAAFGFEISCSGTSIRYIETVEKKGELLLDPKKFFRQVKISARIFVIEEIKGFSSPNLNPEFGQMKFDLEPGDFLAMAEDDSINVDYKYLRFEDALTVQKQSSLKPWEYVFGLDGEGIIIGMGSEFHNFWSHAKKNAASRPYLIMSIYKDCMVAALEHICNNDSAGNYAWERGLAEMLQEHKISLPENVSFAVLNQLAQQMMMEDGVKKVNLS